MLKADCHFIFMGMHTERIYAPNFRIGETVTIEKVVKNLRPHWQSNKIKYNKNRGQIKRRKNTCERKVSGVK